MRHTLAVPAASALLAASLALSACWPLDGPEMIVLDGETMGTTYSLLAVDPPDGLGEDELLDRVEAALAEVNGQMSNWDPNSEVSRFNDADSTDPIPVSEELATVITRANTVHDLSEGRFDVTLAPLIELWGFGPKQPGDPVPTDAQIATALDAVGQSRMLALADGTLAKTRPEVSVNLSAIAKGYGVDRVARELSDAGIGNFVVEIGGDLYAKGLNPDGETWKIGVESPQDGDRQIEAVVPISDAGLATSGDYRNYFEQDGVRYSHIIDPTTGRPITHRTASVTVIAEDAMSADALATAFLALGAEAGLPIAEANGLAVMFITREDSGFVTARSPAFPAPTPLD